MKSQSTYADIIEDKVNEWHSKIDILKKQAEESSSEYNIELRTKLKELQTAIEAATSQLHELDENETQENTVAIKNDILKIFESIDKSLSISEKKTPYMH